MKKWFRKLMADDKVVLNVKKAFKKCPEIVTIRIDIHPNCKGIVSFFIEGEAEPHKIPLEDIEMIW